MILGVVLVLLEVLLAVLYSPLYGALQSLGAIPALTHFEERLPNKRSRLQSRHRQEKQSRETQTLGREAQSLKSKEYKEN